MLLRFADYDPNFYFSVLHYGIIASIWGRNVHLIFQTGLQAIMQQGLSNSSHSLMNNSSRKIRELQ